MQVVVDDKLYQEISGAFLKKFVTTMVATLNGANLLKSDAYYVADEDIRVSFRYLLFRARPT
ncbi:endo-1,4-beta-D-glucanase Y [Bradyrhizobium sp. LA6.1]|uniref:hypothetical protein n=1 Tax=Bradyrhizobium sp. LA6.1 TaxID=3156378 RepID=UPI00339538E8